MFDGDTHHRRLQQMLDRRHRPQQLRLLPLAERLQHPSGERVGPPIELAPLSGAFGGQLRAADPRVAAADADVYQPLALQRSQHPAHVARIEVQPSAKRAHLGALGPLGADLPQQARFADRPAAAEKTIVEGADALGNGAIEAPDLLDRRAMHSLTIVRECSPAQPFVARS